MAIPRMRKGDYGLYQQNYHNDFQKLILKTLFKHVKLLRPIFVV